MMRSCLVVVALIGTLCLCERSPAAHRSAIIPETTAARHGLTRPWFTQVRMDRARARVAHFVLHTGTLFVQTDQAVLHAIDAETGQTLWVAQVGRRGHPSLRPGVNDKLIAVVNGSFLYIVERATGKLLWKTQIDGVPGAGAALSDRRAYVPTVTGNVLAYRLELVRKPSEEDEEPGSTEVAAAGEPQEGEKAETEEARQPTEVRLSQDRVRPLGCQSAGRALVQPIVTRQTGGEEYTVWPTDRGFLFIGRIERLVEDRFVIRDRLETGTEIVAQPSYLPPEPDAPGDWGVIFIPSGDGYVYAIDEKDGSLMWRFSTGEPLIEPVAVIGDRLYVPTRLGGMYCVAAKDGEQIKSGEQLWWTPYVTQFIAASKDRVYAADKLGRIFVLNAKNGARIDTIPTGSLPIKLLNMETDRIYLASETGLVQCLHEIELAEPLNHRRPQEAEKPAAKEEGAEKPEPKPAAEKPAAKPPAGKDNPFQ